IGDSHDRKRQHCEIGQVSTQHYTSAGVACHGSLSMRQVSIAHDDAPRYPSPGQAASGSFRSKLLNELGAKTREFLVRDRARFPQAVELAGFVGDAETDDAPQLVARIMGTLDENQTTNTNIARTSARKFVNVKPPSNSMALLRCIRPPDCLFSSSRTASR